MALVRYRFFRTRGVLANFKAFRREIAKGYSTEVFPLVRREALKMTQGWRVQVEWEQTQEISSRGIAHYMYPAGEGANVWRWVSGGVAGHLIVVKKTRTFRGKGKYAPTLKLQKYAPFTSPGGGFGGPGARFGPMGYRQAVWWPGIAPRNFEGTIGRNVSGPYLRIVEKWVRRGVRAAQREGR